MPVPVTARPATRAIAVAGPARVRYLWCMPRRTSNPSPDEQSPDAGPRPGRVRRLLAVPGRIIGRIPWLRRRYARSTLKSIKRFRDKGQRLPDNLQRIDRQLQRIPAHKRQEALEQMLEMGANNVVPGGRAVRRGASRQERQSGRGSGGLRPGAPPGSKRQVRR